MLFINQSWILFEDNVNTPWSQGLKVLEICYQKKVYSGCQECVAGCVSADQLLFSYQGISPFFHRCGD